MESPRKDIIMSIAVIALGCFISAVGEVHFSLYGTVIYLLSDVFDALRMVWTESMLRERLNVWEGLMLIGMSLSLSLSLCVSLAHTHPLLLFASSVFPILSFLPWGRSISPFAAR